MDADNDNQLPTSPTEAKAIGSTRYYTGQPCNRGHIAQRMTSNRRCVECLREDHVAWSLANAEHRRAYNIAYQATIPADEKRAVWDDWYAENRERIIEKKRQFREDNPGASYEWSRQNRERARVICANYKARKRGNGGSHTADDIENLIKLQRYKCAICGVSIRSRENRDVDHVIPLARGGSNDKSNLQILCVRCNRSKGAKDPIEFAQMHGRLL